MSQYSKKFSKQSSRQSSIGETTSVCSTKSDAKSISSADQYYYANTSASAGSGKKSTGYQQQTANGGGVGAKASGESIQHDETNCKNILNVAEMLLHGVADNEILDIWLKSIQCEEFLENFINSGYDMPTISRITPQDLTAIGVTEPTKRLKILTEIKKLNLQDGIPNFKPISLAHWLELIRLNNFYYKALCDQQIDTIEKLCQLTWEDFEELGITKLGHIKRIQLAIEKVKQLDNLGNNNNLSSKSKTAISEPIYDTNPSQILLVASSENHSMNGPIINKQSSTGELSSTGSGSMHSVYSAASAHYQPTYASLPDNGHHSQPIYGSHNHYQQPTQQQHHQQQEPLTQPPQPIIYQSPSRLVNTTHQKISPATHYSQQQPFSMQHNSLNRQGPPPQFMNAPIMMENNNCNGSRYGHNSNSNQSVNNRQSMSQLSFNAMIANLPKHQQQILQQSSIYATLSRQPAKAKHPPPPVPIRTNSLKTSSLTEQETLKLQQLNSHKLQQQQQQQQQQQIQQPHQFCATIGRDDDFPPPPSPLSVTDADGQDMLSSLSVSDNGSSGNASNGNSSSNNNNTFNHAANMMTFRIGGI